MTRNTSVNKAIIGSDKGLSPVRVSSHYLNQYCHIAKLEHWEQISVKLCIKTDTAHVISENEFENVDFETVAISSSKSEGTLRRWISGSGYE